MKSTAASKVASLALAVGLVFAGVSSSQSAQAYPTKLKATISISASLVRVGQGFTLRLTGFKAFSKIDLYYSFRAPHTSSPVRAALLADHSTSASGSVASSNPVGVPASARYFRSLHADSKGNASTILRFGTPGHYTIWASGIDADGKHIVLSTSFDVLPAASNGGGGSGSAPGTVGVLGNDYVPGGPTGVGVTSESPSPSPSASPSESPSAEPVPSDVASSPTKKSSNDYIPWLVAAAVLLLALILIFAILRNRRDDDVEGPTTPTPPVTYA